MRFVVIENTSIDLRPHYRFDAFSTVHIRDFKIQQLGRQRKREKIKRLSKQWQQLCKCITLVCTFLSRFCTTTTLKCLISRCIEKKKTRNDEKFFLILNLDMVSKNSILGGFAYIWQNKWLGIIPIKTERTQIHFLSVVLVAIASLNLKVPKNKKFENDRVARWEES